jgi:hypothetical protein
VLAYRLTERTSLTEHFCGEMSVQIWKREEKLKTKNSVEAEKNKNRSNGE